MPFTDFTFPEVLSDLSLQLREADLYGAVEPLALPGEFVSRLLDDAALARAVATEKARSEFVVAPVLLELRRLAPGRFGLFSGVELKADPKAGLTGFCDFLLTRDARQFVVTSPILALVEAKNDNVRNGLGQCIAEMVAARVINERAQRPGPVHGAVTTGTAWQFLRLDSDAVTLDTQEYHVEQVARILAILRAIVMG